MCAACASIDWLEPTAADSLDLSQPPQELEHMLEMDSPSVLECFNAVEQAKQVLAEAAAQEKALETQEDAPKARGPGSPVGL